MSITVRGTFIFLDWSEDIKENVVVVISAQSLCGSSRDGFALTWRSVRGCTIFTFQLTFTSIQFCASQYQHHKHEHGCRYAQVSPRIPDSLFFAVHRRGTAVVTVACGFVFFRFAAAGVEFRQQSGRGRFMGHDSPRAKLRANCRHT
jgi:hypothetical protein